MSQVMDILQDTTLTYRQQLNSLAAYADNAAERLDYGSKARQMMKDGLICDLFEGELPYRPRYILPDYAKLMREGCEFLSLKPPTTIWEAIHTLLIFYEHVPSITTFPVYLGNIDTLLDPFVSNETEAYAAIRLFLQHIDRTLTDSFVHANIGPRETPAGRLILRASKELQCSIPNITLKYDPAITSESFALLAADTALDCAKPSFCDHQQYIADFGTEDYAIASCYNGFPIGGGGYTLIRLLLSHVAATASSVEDFFQHSLPEAAGQILHIIDVRSRFIRNDCAFFQSSFLVKEGFIQPDRFAGMLGVVGLAEAVNTLLKPSCQQERFGYGKAANALGLRIIDTLSKMVREHTCEVVGCNSGSHYLTLRSAATSMKASLLAAVSRLVRNPTCSTTSCNQHRSIATSRMASVMSSSLKKPTRSTRKPCSGSSMGPSGTDCAISQPMALVVTSCGSPVIWPSVPMLNDSNAVKP